MKPKQPTDWKYSNVTVSHHVATRLDDIFENYVQTYLLHYRTLSFAPVARTHQNSWLAKMCEDTILRTEQNRPLPTQHLLWAERRWSYKIIISMLSAYLSILGLHNCPYDSVLELLTAADVREAVLFGSSILRARRYLRCSIMWTWSEPAEVFKLFSWYQAGSKRSRTDRIVIPMAQLEHSLDV